MAHWKHTTTTASFHAWIDGRYIGTVTAATSDDALAAIEARYPDADTWSVHPTDSDDGAVVFV